MNRDETADERRLRINSICVNLRLSRERSERAVTREVRAGFFLCMCSSLVRNMTSSLWGIIPISMSGGEFGGTFFQGGIYALIVE